MKINDLNESSLSRIADKIKNHATGAVTAYRGSKTYAENQANNKKVLAVLLDYGFSVTKVRGSYIENKGAETEQEVGENSFFVANTKVQGDDGGQLEEVLIKLGQAFDQDSILSVRHEGSATLIGTSDRDDAWPSKGERVSVGKPTFGDPQGDFFSRIGGRKFAFEEEVHLPDTTNGRWALSKIAKDVLK